MNDKYDCSMNTISQDCSTTSGSFTDAIWSDTSWAVFLKIVEDIVKGFSLVCEKLLEAILAFIVALYSWIFKNVTWSIGFSLWVFNKMAFLFYIFNVEHVSWKIDGIFLKVSFFVIMQYVSNAIGTSNKSNKRWPLLAFPWFCLLWFDLI